MTDATQMIQAFLEDENAWQMFITGRAGTGKTTSLAEVVSYLMDNDISYVVCAFTHKACGVLQSKLPAGAIIETLHRYLRKRPGINEHATKLQHVNVNTKMGDSARPQIVIVDEYSMVGERDYCSLMELTDEEYEGHGKIKLVYVGDPYQLLPVGDQQTITPRKPYWLELKHVYRTENNDLLDLMTRLVGMLNGDELEPLEPSSNFIRGQNLARAYRSSLSTDKVCLAWTNRAVEELNQAIASKKRPESSDSLWCPTLRQEFYFDFTLSPSEVESVMTPRGLLPLNTKFKTLEFLTTMRGIEYAAVYNQTIEERQVLAYVFGHYQYKLMLEQLTTDAVSINQKIQVQTTLSPAEWARANPQTNLAQERAKAWRKLLAFKEAVVCLDFPYAMTIHKSQGSTYEEVYLDSDDLALCGNTNLDMYLRLFYVAVSRASKKVITNQIG